MTAPLPSDPTTKRKPLPSSFTDGPAPKVSRTLAAAASSVVASSPVPAPRTNTPAKAAVPVEEVLPSPVPAPREVAKDAPEDAGAGVLETDLESAGPVVAMETTVEVPVSVDSSSAAETDVSKMDEIDSGKAKKGKNKKVQKDASTASTEDERSRRSVRNRQKGPNASVLDPLEQVGTFISPNLSPRTCFAPAPPFLLLLLFLLTTELMDTLQVRQATQNHSQPDPNVSTSSSTLDDTKDSGRPKRIKKGKKAAPAQSPKAVVADEEVVPASPKEAAKPRSKRGKKRKQDEDSSMVSNLSSMSSSSQDNSIEHLSVSQNVQNISAEGEVKEKEKEVEAKVRSTRTKQINKLLEELETVTAPASPKEKLMALAAKTKSLTEVSDKTKSLAEVSDKTKTLAEVSDKTKALAEVSDKTKSLTEISDKTKALTDAPAQAALSASPAARSTRTRQKLAATISEPGTAAARSTRSKQVRAS